MNDFIILKNGLVAMIVIVIMYYKEKFSFKKKKKASLQGKSEERDPLHYVLPKLYQRTPIVECIKSWEKQQIKLCRKMSV